MRIITPEQAWFSFNGVRSTAMGVRMAGQLTFTSPAARGREEDVYGRDGKLWIPEGAFERVTGSVKLVCADDADLSAVSAWLSGEGELIRGTEPNYAYKARITKSAKRQPHMLRDMNEEWTQEFSCEPFKYLATPADDITLTSASESIANPGNVASAPLLCVSLTAEGALTIGADTMSFSGFEEALDLYVDCDAKICYMLTEGVMTLANQYAGGDWFHLEPGVSAVSLEGGVESVAVTPRWRWLV